MERKYFGTDGIRGRANRHPMTANMALKVAQAAGRHFTPPCDQSPAVGGDRQGHAPIRLYAGAGDDRRFYLLGHGRGVARSHADAGGGRV